MNIPAELFYTDTHEWVRLDKQEAVIGITDFAQHQLGDITFVDLPSVGTVLSVGKDLGTVESVKAASDLYAPVSGTVTAVNEALADHPELINKNPYQEGWMVRVALNAQPEGLYSATDYETLAHE